MKLEADREKERILSYFSTSFQSEKPKQKTPSRAFLWIALLFALLLLGSCLGMIVLLFP